MKSGRSRHANGPHSRLPALSRRVVDDVDRALVVRRALTEAGEVAEIAAGGEYRVDAGHLRDLVRILQSVEGLDHLDQHDVVVDRVAIAAWHVAPHSRIERLPAAVAAAAERRKVGPVARLNRLGLRVDRRHDDDQRAGVKRVLDFALVGVGDAYAGHGLGVRTRAPHARDRFPVPIVVLHLGPDEVVAGIGHRAVGCRVGGAEQRAAGYFPTLHQLQLDRIPDLRALRRVEGAAVFPRRRVERSLIHRPRRRGHPRAAILASRGGERERGRAGRRVVGVRIGSWRRCLRRRCLTGEHDDADNRAQD